LTEDWFGHLRAEKIVKARALQRKLKYTATTGEDATDSLECRFSYPNMKPGAQSLTLPYKLG
jgi:hypothetical protein